MLYNPLIAVWMAGTDLLVCLGSGSGLLRERRGKKPAHACIVSLECSGAVKACLCPSSCCVRTLLSRVRGMRRAQGESSLKSLPFPDAWLQLFLTGQQGRALCKLGQVCRKPQTLPMAEIRQALTGPTLVLVL